MYRLSSIIFVLLVSMQIFAQSPHGEALKIDCAKCHNPESWSINFNTIEFDHEKLAKFVLEGAHAQVDCKQCHSTLVFDEAKTDCISCHKDMHSGSVGNDCVRCHTSNSWVVDNIPELHEENGFALTGSHSNLSCTECHKSETNLRFDRIGNDCISCHRDDYLDSENPNHISANYATSCTDCHNPLATAWTPANFDHEKFPLTLGHDVQDCKKCHTTALYADTSSECISCHQNDFNNTTNPNHENAQFSTDCVSCHTTDLGWTPSSYDHNIFPLTLGHDVQDCKECHKTTNYSDTSSECVSCHQTDFNTTVNPNHNNAGFSTDCKSCHTTRPDWNPTNWKHDFFPLTLAHDLPNCIQCHTTTNFADASSECVSCHQTDFNATTNPNHISAGFSTNCVTCHTTNPNWTPSSWNHNSFYPLNGAHATIANDCATCHKGNYTTTPNTCVGCHLSDFNSTTNPNHSTSKFSTDCTTCHTEGSWIPSTFNHDFFPLTLGHATPSCTQCHTTGNYADASPNCVTCHQTDFNTTTNPNHISAGFPTDCVTCHTTNPNWTPTTFNHNSFYPLNGAHAAIANNCVTCHNGNYNTTPNTCVGCHLSDFNGTTNPNHSTLKFSTDCTTCHTEGSWTPSTFNHDGQYFPIYSGEHQGEWNACTDCHTNTSNYAVFACINCHEHNNKTEVDNDHQGVNNYAYTSNACYSCHPDGKD